MGNILCSSCTIIEDRIIGKTVLKFQINELGPGLGY